MVNATEAGSSVEESFSNSNYVSQVQWGDLHGGYSLDKQSGLQFQGYEQPGSFGEAGMQYAQGDVYPPLNLNQSDDRGYRIVRPSAKSSELLERLVALDDVGELFNQVGDKTWARPLGLRSKMIKGSGYGCFMTDGEFEENKAAEMENGEMEEEKNVRNFRHMIEEIGYESLEEQESTVEKGNQPANVLDKTGNWEQRFKDANSSAAARVAEAKAVADSMAAKAAVALEKVVGGKRQRARVEKAAKAAARVAEKVEKAANERQSRLARRTEELKFVPSSEEGIVYSSYDDYKNSGVAREAEAVRVTKAAEKKIERQGLKVYIWNPRNES